MPPARKDYRAELARFNINTQTGREQILTEIGKAYEGLYPRRAAWFKTQLRRLREVTTTGYRAGRAGEMHVSMRVPTELWLFIQRWLPDFGQDSKDIELLTRVWCDLVRVHRRDPRRRTQLVVKEDLRRGPQPQV